jgi:ribosomal protein S5
MNFAKSVTKRLFSTGMTFVEPTSQAMTATHLEKQSSVFNLSSLKPVAKERETYRVHLKLFSVKVVKLQTKFGKRSRFQAVVFAGDGHGGIGMAIEKCSSVSGAFKKASRTATKNMEHFELHEGRTLFHDAYVRFHRSRLYLFAAAPGKENAAF